MYLAILRDSFGETFGLAVIEKLKKKNESEELGFQKKNFLKMEGGRSVETLLRQEHYHDSRM